MKTITFYAYKGGTGRTLTLANLAMCLSRLGKNVCVLDFDFEAPGLHHKFDRGTVQKGALDYIWKYIESGYKKAPDSITLYTQKIKPGDSGNNGVIHLIPAGNVHSIDYWLKLTSPKWHRMFYFTLEVIKGELEEYELENNLRFFLNMKESIAQQLEPKPDYLLVDARTGITERAGVCTRLWADNVIFLFLNNRENLEGTRLIWRAFESVPRLSYQKAINSIFTLTRIPKIEEQRGLKIKENILNYLNEGIEVSDKRIKIDDICVLHSDRELELKETLRVKIEGPTENVLLSHEYIHLFAHIIPEEAKGFYQIDHIVSFFRTVLGLAESLEEVERIFTLYLKPGKMINPVDGEQNVSLKVETFNRMLSDIYKSIKERLIANDKADDKSEVKARDEANKFFFHAGLDCGGQFGKELIKEVWKGGDNLKIQEKFEKWCAFDSNVGFGSFSNEIKINENGQIASGKIVLTSNFLASGRKPEEPNLCKFMAGYIQGVLRELTGTEVEVTHEVKNCMQYQQGKKECDFHFRRVE